MFDKNGDCISGFAIMKCPVVNGFPHPDKESTLVATHECLGNAEEHRMFLNEIAETEETTFVIKETFGAGMSTDFI
jgi:hypothetical protein